MLESNCYLSILDPREGSHITIRSIFPLALHET